MMRPYPTPTLLLASLVLAPALSAQTADQHPSDVPNAYFKYTYILCPGTPGMSPPVSSRAYGYMGLAAYESIVDGVPGWTSLEGDLPELGTLPATNPDSVYHWPTCANYALCCMADSLFYNGNVTVLGDLHMIRDGFDAQFAGEPADVLARSRAFGTAIANAVLDMARTDGAYRSQTTNFDPNYFIPAGPGFWQPAPGQNALQAHWGNKRPFMEADTMNALMTVVPPPVDSVPGSACYDAALEVYQRSQTLTATDTLTARYWADDVKSPPTHYVQLTEQLMRREGKDLAFAARGYAIMTMSVADAFVACWRWKYMHNWHRPRHYIPQYIDANWMPIINTPPFPEFTSGHSSGSGAWGESMNEVFGTNFAFTDSTHGALFGGPRSYPSFDSAAAECANSRLLGGIHYTFSNINGLENGALIAQNIVALFDGLITAVEPTVVGAPADIRYDATNGMLIPGASVGTEHIRVVAVGSGIVVRNFRGGGPYALGRLPAGAYVAEVIGAERTIMRFVHTAQ
ncbi:MAG: vanadium-dependent haloperoxidase [Flavobacteriales bacterium]|nr:MAG: vanadium-dependent haloperoxidase [Flavobacteriales bacterium]